MELNQPPPSSQNPDSDLSHQIPPAQPLALPSSPPHLPPRDLYRQIHTYPFHSDQDYQLGLAAILGHPETGPSPSELASNQDLVLQAQCFYLARKFGLGQIDVEAYKEWLASTSQTPQIAEQYGRNGKGNENGIGLSSEPPSTGHANAAAISSPPVHPPTTPDRPSAPTPSTAAAATTNSAQTISTSDPAPPYPTSFADIVDLITQDKPIPGIEEIPTTVLEPGSSKQDRAVRRKKPWEKDQEGDGAAVAETGAADDGQGEKEKKQEEEDDVDITHRIQTGEGVMKILQPGAVPDSGLIAKE